MVRFDPIWRRIKPDSFTEKFEGRFPERRNRLDGLNNWGALSWLHPHAGATKLAHHYGLERNAGQFLAGDQARDNYRPSFRTAAHVLHWGHVPLSYAGEEALLRAARVDDQVAAVVRKVIDEVVVAGDLQCDDEGHDCVSASRSGERPFELYRWLSAWIVRKNWSRVWKAIKDAAPGSGQHETEVRKELIRALVCRQDRGYRVLTMCNQADYVPRDLLQAGTAWLTFDIEALWEPNPLGSDAAREWSLIKSAQEYLDHRFFRNPESLLVHSLAARAIAGGIVAEGITAASLAGLTLETDEYFTNRLPTYHRTRLAETQAATIAGTLTKAWTHVGSFSGVSLPEGSPFDMEDHLTGRSGGTRVTYPFSLGTCVVVEAGHAVYPDFFAG